MPSAKLWFTTLQVLLGASAFVVITQIIIYCAFKNNLNCKGCSFVTHNSLLLY